MNYTMTKPCPHCPFRTDIPGYLTEERADEIAESTVEMQLDFPCHQTTVDVEDDEGEGGRAATKDSQMCAGAMIMCEKMNRPTQMMRIAERLGMYDPRKLDMKAPVVDDATEFIQRHEHEEKARRRKRRLVSKAGDRGKA